MIAILVMTVLAALVLTYWLSTRNPGLQRRLEAAEKRAGDYDRLVAGLRKRLEQYSGTDPVAASLLDDINEAQGKEIT